MTLRVPNVELGRPAQRILIRDALYDMNRYVPGGLAFYCLLDGLAVQADLLAAYTDGRHGPPFRSSPVRPRHDEQHATPRARLATGKPTAVTCA